MRIETNPPSFPESPHVVIGAQSNDHSAYLAGIPSKRFFTDARVFAQVQLLVTEYYRLDALSNFWDVYNVEAEAIGQKVVYHPGGIPDTDRTRPLIRTPAHLDRISPPRPEYIRPHAVGSGGLSPFFGKDRQTGAHLFYGPIQSGGQHQGL